MAGASPGQAEAQHAAAAGPSRLAASAGAADGGDTAGAGGHSSGDASSSAEGTAAKAIALHSGEAQAHAPAAGHHSGAHHVAAKDVAHTADPAHDHAAHVAAELQHKHGADQLHAHAQGSAHGQGHHHAHSAHTHSHGHTHGADGAHAQDEHDSAHAQPPQSFGLVASNSQSPKDASAGSSPPRDHADAHAHGQADQSHHDQHEHHLQHHSREEHVPLVTNVASHAHSHAFADAHGNPLFAPPSLPADSRDSQPQAAVAGPSVPRAHTSISSTTGASSSGLASSAPARQLPDSERMARRSARRAARRAARALLDVARCCACGDMLQEPVTLPCGHTSCLRCLCVNAGLPLTPPHAQGDAAAPPAAGEKGASSSESGGTGGTGAHAYIHSSSSASASLPSTAGKTPAAAAAAIRHARHLSPPPLPCISHVPPRFPLSSSTVPCPQHGCPRSAIGRGLGLWAGQSARYGPELHPKHRERAGSDDANGEADGAGASAATSGSTDPGVPPVDGFVIGAAEHTFRLSVIPAQKKEARRDYFVNTFGEPSDEQQQHGAHHSRSHSQSEQYGPAWPLGHEALRTDVTLVKVLNVLRAFAGADEAPREQQRQRQPRASRSARPVGAHAHSRTAIGGSKAHSAKQHHPQSQQRRSTSASALAKARAARAASPPPHMHSEASLESGTQSGVSAVPTRGNSEEADDHHHRQQHSLEHQHRLHLHRPDLDHQHGAFDMDEQADGFDAISEDEDGDSGLQKGAKRHDRASMAGATSSSQQSHARASKAKRKRSLGLLSGQHIRPSGTGAKWSPARDTDWSDWDSETAPANAASNDEGDELDERDGEDGGAAASHGASARAEHKKSGVGAAEALDLERLHAELLDTVECQLCYNLLYKPLTTPCGHTFCRACFSRSLDHGDKCPLCRTALPSFAFFQAHPGNLVLTALLTAQVDADPAPTTAQPDAASVGGGKTTFGFKHLYEARKAALEMEENDAHMSTPIFVCTLAFPGMPTVLHIFEPRYRLMIRRCLESGNPRFGMVLPSRTTTGPVPGVSPYGTMLEIKSVQMLPDGRSMLETVGSYRFRLLEKGSLDGYTVGRIERIDDLSPQEEAELEAAVLARNSELAASTPAANAAPAPQPTEPTAPDHPSEVSQASANGMRAERTPSNEGSATLSPAPATPAMGTPTLPSGMPTPSTASEPAPPQREPSTAELVDTCMQFISTLRSGSAPWLLTRLNHTYGPMPEAHEVERLGYWMALIMPIDEHEKAKLLPIRSPRLRLRLVVHWIEQLRQSWWFSSGCSIS